MALVYKYSNNYGCAIIVTYANDQGVAPYYIQLKAYTWTDGILLR